MSMFRTDYTNLSLSQVKELVTPGAAPETASADRADMPSDLAGTTMRIALDKEPVAGPVLEYKFINERSLSLSENGSVPVICNYGAVKHKDMVLFSHTIPGSLRGWTVAADRKTGIVTASEMWFPETEGRDLKGQAVSMLEAMTIEPFTNRETQRQIYTGYIDSPELPVPEKRAHLSLRLDNRMMFWEDSLGRKQLVTYTSSLFSTLVEVGDPDGEDVMTFPTDVLQLSDSLFVYCRSEVEFAGRFVFEILDLNASKKIGVTFGIDEKDRYEYKLYTAKGRSVGQYATFHDFNDNGLTRSPNHTRRLDFTKRGTRAAYRASIMARTLTDEALREYAKDPHLFYKITNPTEKQMMASTNFMEESSLCVGKTITVTSEDGFASEYRFPELRRLEYRAPGEEEWHSEMYHAFALDDNLVCLGHYRSGVYPPTSRILFLDFDNGQASCIESYIGGKRDLHDVVPSYHFGTFTASDGSVAPASCCGERHGFTRELLGRSFTWTYSSDMTSQHIYNAPHSYSWTIINNTTPGDPMNRAGGYVWSSPCEYLKLRKDVYVMFWVEERWEGLSACAAMNLKLMHDCGFSFGIGLDGQSVMMDIMGAQGRNAGKADLDEVY